MSKTSYTTIRVARVSGDGTSSDPLSYKDDTNGSIALVTLNRPKNANAFTDQMASELSSLIRLLDADPRVKVVVVTGSGKHFCVGADLDEGFHYEATPENHRDGGGMVSMAISDCRKPVIAAINGHAVGVGITMTLPMSIRITCSQAKIAFPFARRGIAMEACSSYFLPRLVGFSLATYLVTTGATFPATSPLVGTLFHEIMDANDKVLPRAMALAKEIALNTSTVSNAVMKDLMWWSNPQSAYEAHRNESFALGHLHKGVDQQEGIDSFLHKRPAKFPGTLEKDLPPKVGKSQSKL